MGGKDANDQKVRATQDQLRLARITQEVNPSDDDRVMVQKLIKKVVETTHCTENDAEIALFDTDNNVEAAVNAILENVYSGKNVWMEQKSRKAKRAEAEERTDDFQSSNRPKLFNSPRGAGRGKGSERGRGGYRGGRGGGRGNFTREGYNSQVANITNNNVWDNSMALKVENKKWSSDAVSIDDIPEDTDWKSAGTLIFSRRDEVLTPPESVSTPSLITGSVTTSDAPMVSFATVAATGLCCTNNQKEKLATGRYISSNNAIPQQQSIGNSVNQTGENGPIYHSSTMVSSSSQLAVSSEAINEHDRGARSPSSSICRGHNLPTASPAVITSASQVSRIDNVSTNNSSTDWTTQLKNDLGIGTKTAQSSQSVRKASDAKPSVQGRIGSRSVNTVEFVSGDINGSSALPEYQFGFNVDATAGGDEVSGDVFSTKIKDRQSNNPSTKIESEANNGSASLLMNGTVGDYTSSISKNSPSQGAAPSSGGSGGIASVSSQIHPSTGVQRQPPSGLSYADTSIMSYYPPSDNRSNAALTNKPSQTLHHQQQQPHQPLYTAAQIPYGSYPYLNMYSPVTGVRQDETQYAATALVQYPFGVGQIDMSSLSTMLPPAAIASQQPNQPPPPMQGQHQQRPDQHGNFVDLKAYAAAANNTAGGGSGSGLLGAQQQRDSSVNNSAVAPPPGFSGPPSNLPAAFTLSQHNHLSSLFQMQPTYHPSLSQVPFSFMLPNVSGNGQHKIGHQIFPQQNVDETMVDQRLPAQQQKVYSAGHQQMEKYGNTGGTSKDRLNSGAQATPPPGIYQQQGYLAQQIPPHSHNKKAYGNGPQHWGTN